MIDDNQIHSRTNYQIKDISRRNMNSFLRRWPEVRHPLNYFRMYPSVYLVLCAYLQVIPKSKKKRNAQR